MTNYRIVFSVASSGAFPVDMLRYDACYPSRESDSLKIMSYEDGKEHIVELAKITENKAWRPANKRWESFGWRVLNVEINKY